MKIAPILTAFCAFLPLAAHAQQGPTPISCRSAAAKAEVERAFLALDNVRVAEASAALQKAVELEPDCATAQAFLATVLPGTEAESHLKIALAHLAGLTPAERVRIELVAAGFEGNNKLGRELTARMVELSPGDWRARNGLGAQALGDLDYEKAIVEFKRAIEINPQAAGAYNNLGYSYAGQEKYEEAAATFRKYAEIAPNEPNAHDSLAEVLMNGGKLAEAEAEFQKALAIDPKFAGAWTGIAQTRLLRGDDAGAEKALRAELDVDTRPQAVIGTEINIAFGAIAQGRTKEGYRKLNEVEARAKKLGLPQMYFIDAIQARVQMREGNLPKALALANTSLKMTRGAKVSTGLKRGLMQGVLIEVVRAHALLKHRTETEKALAEMEQVVQPAAQIAFNASQLQNARGIAAFGKGDASAAVAAMKQCRNFDFQCLYELERVQEESGDTAGAAASRAAFLRTPRRGIEYVVLWKKLGGRPQATANRVAD